MFEDYCRLKTSSVYKRVSFGLRNTNECSMTYRQSETYTRVKYLKNLPLQPVSSKALDTDETDTDAELARVSVLTLDVTKTAYVSPVASVWQVS